MERSRSLKFGIFILAILGIAIPLMFRSCQMNSYGDSDKEGQSYTMDVVVDEYGDMHVVETVVMEYLSDDVYLNDNYLYKDIVYSPPRHV